MVFSSANTDRGIASPFSGYKVIFVPFSGGRPAGSAGGYSHRLPQRKEEALGRPVGVVIDRAGALLTADDVGNVIWRVASASKTAQTQR